LLLFIFNLYFSQTEVSCTFKRRYMSEIFRTSWSADKSIATICAKKTYI